MSRCDNTVAVCRMASISQAAFGGTLFFFAFILSDLLIITSGEPRLMNDSNNSSLITSILGRTNEHNDLNNPSTLLSELLDQVSSDTFVEHRQKRDESLSSTDIGLAWICNTTVQWRELGSLHFPRFIKEVTCAENSCYWGFYTCRPQYYIMKTLTMRLEHEDIDHKLPDELKPLWKFVDVSISVGCECSI